MAEEQQPDKIQPAMTLRERAEAMVRASPRDIARMSASDIEAMIYELQVHQVELEIQNEELRQAQMALAESRDRYSDLYEFAPVGYLTLNEVGTIEEANLTAAGLLGVDRGRIVGRKITAFITRNSQDDWHQHSRTLFSSEGTQACEVELRSAGGHTFWARLEGTVRQPQTGPTLKCRTALIDITQQKQAEEVLKQVNRELQQTAGTTAAVLQKRIQEVALLAKAVSNLAEGVLITSDYLEWPGPKIVFVNEALCRISGYNAEELIGQTPRILQGEQTNREAMSRLKKKLLAGEAHSCEVINYRKDGTPYHAELFVAPLFDPAGARTNFVSIHRDISERKQHRQELKEREERLSAVLNTAADAIITIDQRGTIESVNPATEAMFGYTQDELICRNVSLLMPPPFCDEHDGYIEHFLKTGEAKIIGIGREVTGQRKDGTIFPMDLAVSQVDHLGLFTGIIRDISERKVAQQKLIQSERLAALGEAMAGLTHESRNALARSLANLRRLERRLQGQDELLRMIEGAWRANDDIRRQFDEVRDYAAPIHLSREPLDLAEIIQHTWDHLAAERHGRQSKLRLDGKALDLSCQADPFLLRNVFRNLFENALAACPDPVGIDIQFREAMIDSTPAIDVSVRDNGPGLPPDVRQRAFDAFFTTRTRGTGLGLAIVKRSVEAHGGAVAFGPESERGTEVIITLPRSVV